MRTTALFFAAALLASPVAIAQSLNIDLEPVSTPHGSPPGTFAAAGGLGFWNFAAQLPAGVMRDLGSDLCPVTLTYPTLDASFVDNTRAAAPPGPAWLLNDALTFEANLVTLTFSNLIAGNYRLITYGAGNLSFAGETVTVQGVSEFMASFWSGAFNEGDDHTIHDAVVSATGLLEVEFSVIGFSSITVNGFQLERLGEQGNIGCQGDGTFPGQCPCGNDASGPSEGCTTTAGSGMRIWGTGSVSIATDDLVLTTVNVPVGNTGLYYCGSQNLSSGQVLFDGLQCTGGNALRFRGQLATTSTVVDSGFVSQDIFGLFFQPGNAYTFQYFTRDNQAGASPCGGFANLSPGLRVLMVP